MSEAARVPVLMYHRVGDVRHEGEARYAISAANFAAHMRALALAGYRGVGIDALVGWILAGSPLPAGAVLITFDDGFRGVRDHALPVLERLNWPFAVFLVSDLIGARAEWTRLSERHSAPYPLLNIGEIRDMQSRGCSFHSHTRSHANLPTLDNRALDSELRESRTRLQEVLDDEVRYLAYPYGQVDERVEAATCAAGYTAAFATESGFNRQGANRFRIRRLDVYGTDTPAMLMRKIHLGSNDGSLGEMVGYYLRRVASRLPRIPS